MSATREPGAPSEERTAGMAHLNGIPIRIEPAHGGGETDSLEETTALSRAAREAR
jgi:hypothetical protein